MSYDQHTAALLKDNTVLLKRIVELEARLVACQQERDDEKAAFDLRIEDAERLYRQVAGVLHDWRRRPVKIPHQPQAAESQLAALRAQVQALNDWATEEEDHTYGTADWRQARREAKAHVLALLCPADAPKETT